MAKGVPIQGRNPSGNAQIANVTAEGDLKVQLSGTIVDAIPLVESESIRDTNERVARLSSAGINPREYVRFDYYIRNRLRTDVFVGFGRTTGDPMSIPLIDGGKGIYGTAASHVSHIVPHTDHVPWPLSWLPLREEHKAVDPLPYQRLILNLSANVDLLFRPVSAPTTGDISIWFVGWRA